LRKIASQQCVAEHIIAQKLSVEKDKQAKTFITKSSLLWPSRPLFLISGLVYFCKITPIDAFFQTYTHYFVSASSKASFPTCNYICKGHHSTKLVKKSVQSAVMQAVHRVDTWMSHTN